MSVIINGLHIFKGMIKYKSCSIFEAFESPSIQTIVNTINCIGVMGKGLALEFRIRYPEMFEDYKKRCERGEVKVGQPYLYKTSEKWILNFPTKYHWKYPSRTEYIEKGLEYFVDHYKEWGINSIAFPRLGSSEGKLNWEKDVKPLMEKYLSNLDDIKIYIYLDQAPSIEEKKLLDLLNTTSEENIRRKFDLSERQIKFLKNHIKERGNLTRIRDLLKIKGVGKKTYQKVIKRKISETKNIQQKLFS